MTALLKQNMFTLPLQQFKIMC